MEIKLGSECIDLVTGFKGIAVARTVWLNGCARVTLQPKMGKDNKVPETVTFDEPQLKLLKAAAVPQGPRTTGGPIPESITARPKNPIR